MNMKYILLLSPLVFAGCDSSAETRIATQAAEKTNSLIAENIGWIHGACLAIKNGKIKPGTNVQMIVLSKPQSIVNATVKGITESEKGCPALLSDRVGINKQEGRYFYSLDMRKATQDFMAIGAVSTVKARNINNNVELDINDDGVGEHAGTCLNSEGVQFYVSSSAAFNEKAVWSDYYYLGYDTKPTCP